MTAPNELIDLVERFARDQVAYQSGRYNETQARIEFIDPLFRLLGWDVDNRSGTQEPYKDVVHEDAIKISGKHKAPDYGFRVGGTRKFFVEAKKPSVNISGDIDPAFQLRRYAWSSKLPLSILTDFEEFAVYDCSIAPSPEDSTVIARLNLYNYTEYPDRWSEIADVFSKEAVLSGSLDKQAANAKTRRGTATVDEVFLNEIEAWREALAIDLAANNHNLTRRELNAAVQVTIDRIIFLRMAEDRGIEKEDRLKGLLTGGSVYDRLKHYYQEADDKYNSGLFHFQRERGRTEEPDRLTTALTISDPTLEGIIRKLYLPESPYEFSVFPIEVLGHVYERFLGKVIDLSKDRTVTIEEKPEVRKAGGVYYTPKFIVDYIVNRTLDKLLKDRRPGPNSVVRRLRIVDPACGSGSFLIGAYEYLLDWHRDRYLENPARHRNVLYQGQGGRWLLTTDEKKRILLENIYGVDIDPQAVEVTKLSLLLKVLEGESSESLITQLRMLQTRALPDLSDNIKCGNSLIGPDFYNSVQLSFLDEEDHYTINVFDWKTAFPEVFTRDNPGFDAVIGNPPYLNIDDTWGRGDPRQRYIRAAYESVYNDKTDILFYFLAKAVQISRREVSYIVSRAFLEAYKADKLRHWLGEQSDITEIIDFRNRYIFEGVGITTAIASLSKGGSVPTADFYVLRDQAAYFDDLKEQKRDPNLFQHLKVDQSAFTGDSWLFADKALEAINMKVDASSDRLGDVLHIGKGMETGRNGVFAGLSCEQVESWGLHPGQYFRRARNSDIQRYHIRDSGPIALYLEDFARFEDLPEGVQAYLLDNEASLKERAAYQRGDCDWWRFTWPLHKEHLHKPKLLCPYLATHNRFALDEQQQFLGLTDTTILYDNGQPEDLRYLLGLLNSRLLTFRFRFIGKLKSGGILEYFWNSISKLPIRRIDFADARDQELHDQVVERVGLTMSLHSHYFAARTSHERAILQHRIRATEAQIDQLVYRLYELTGKEITLVEQAM